MKVGTDGVLLGTWSPLPNTCQHILDIGTGTGLIALLLAQRHPSALIDAIDISPEAISQAATNIAQSPWPTRISCQISAIQTWEVAYQYDLIVSNPPYFQNSLHNPDACRTMARHTDTLSYQSLCECAYRMLQPKGIFAVILPAEALGQILSIAKGVGLTAIHLTRVYSKPGKPIRRILVAFQHSENALPYREDIFYIESAHSTRSEEYIELTKDFYL